MWAYIKNLKTNQFELIGVDNILNYIPGCTNKKFKIKVQEKEFEGIVLYTEGE